GAFEARQHVQGGSLAGARRSEECQKLTAAYAEIQAADGMKMAVHFLDVDEFDKLGVGLLPVLAIANRLACRRGAPLPAADGSRLAGSGGCALRQGFSKRRTLSG